MSVLLGVLELIGLGAAGVVLLLLLAFAAYSVWGRLFDGEWWWDIVASELEGRDG